MNSSPAAFENCQRDVAGFKEALFRAAEALRDVPKDCAVRLISHLDADGITSASIVIKMLQRDKRAFEHSVIQQLSIDSLEQFSKEDYLVFIFTDLGSGQVGDIIQKFSGKRVIILDHHDLHDCGSCGEVPERSDSIKNSIECLKGSLTKNIFFPNPRIYGIDGGKEISGAGVAYLFAKSFDSRNADLAHIAILGAIGDVQENKGFMELNQDILDDAVSSGKMEVTRGLRLYGAQTRPMHKALEYSSDPYIPGVSGSESGAFQLLLEAGIDPQNGKGWKTLVDLSEEEQQRLIAHVIMRRVNEKSPEDVLGYYFTLVHEDKGSPLRDAKEFSTLLNACGRLGFAQLGVGACLGDLQLKKQAIEMHRNYKREIVTALNWYRQNTDDSSHVLKGDNHIIINGGTAVMSTMIGTLLSILSKSNEYPEGLFMLGLARAENNTTKVSLRISGYKNETDLTGVIREIVEIAGGEAGGHMNAAGAMIPTDKESLFIEAAQKVFGKCAAAMS